LDNIENSADSEALHCAEHRTFGRWTLIVVVLIVVVLVDVVVVPAETTLVGHQNNDTLLAFSNLPAEFLPLPVAGDPSRVRTLGKDKTR